MQTFIIKKSNNLKMKKLPVLLLLALITAILSGFLPVNRFPVKAQGEKVHQVKAFLLTEDGANAEVMEEMASQGKLPNLGRFRKEAARAEYIITNFPSKTAPSHASLFCGCFGDRNGISSNMVQKGKDFTILDLSTGFSASNLLAEPVWAATARQGLKTVILYNPQCGPAKKFLDGPGGKNLVIFDGYGTEKSPYEILEMKDTKPSTMKWKNAPKHEGKIITREFKVGDTTLHLAILDTDINGKTDYTRIAVAEKPDFRGTDTVVVKKVLSPWFTGAVPVKYGKGWSGVYFQLLSMDENGGAFRMVKSSTYMEEINGKLPAREYIVQTGGFIGNGDYNLYTKGEFGKTLFEGGRGKAEETYLQSVILVNGILRKKLRYAVEKYKPDFVVGYTPFPDESLHMWLGLVRNRKTEKDREISKMMTFYLDMVYAYADWYLGEVMKLSSKDTVTALAGDHGMDACDKIFTPNSALKNAGLLIADEKGKIDLSRTKIIYGNENGAFLRVNTTDYKGGIVPPDKKDEVIREAVIALTKVRDPHTGEALVTGFYYPSTDGENFGIGGPRGGDVYLDILPGYYFSSGVEDSPVKDTRPGGAHVYMPRRPAMHTMFYLKSPGVKGETVLPPARIIDIVPTVCRLLNIKPPADAVGKAIIE